MFEKNLISISKLIFKLTRCENNDAIFYEEKIVHSLLNVINKYEVSKNNVRGDSVNPFKHKYLFCV